MINPILAKLYGIILEKKISLWLEGHGNRELKVRPGLGSISSLVDHLVDKLSRMRGVPLGIG
jgi:hypothetical protein